MTWLQRVSDLLLNDESLRSVSHAAVKLFCITVLYWLARKTLFRVVDVALARVLAVRDRAAGREDPVHRVRTLQGLVKSLTGYVLFFVFVVTALQALSVDVTGLLTTAGIGGVAVGFGAQRLVRDVISGFFIIMEDQFAVGDYVTLGGATGEVVDQGMRICKIRDEQGRLWTIANGDVTTVVNHSRTAVTAKFDVAVASWASPEHSRGVVAEACEIVAEASDDELSAPPKVLGLAGYDAAQALITVEVSAAPNRLLTAQLRVREAVREALVREGIAPGMTAPAQAADVATLAN